MLFCSLAFVPDPARASGEQARIHFLQALKAKQEGNLLAAESLLQKAVEIEPQNPDFRFELGNLYVERGNLEGARMELEQTVMVAPVHIPAHYNLGLVYRDLGLTGEARAQFREVLELDPSNVKAELQIGYTYEQEGFLDEARQAFERAKDMDMTNPEPSNALEKLAQAENEAQYKTRREMAESFQRNQNFLYFPDSQPPPGSTDSQLNRSSQPSGKEALVQAGAVLIQELLSRRSRASSENGDNSSTS